MPGAALGLKFKTLYRHLHVFLNQAGLLLTLQLTPLQGPSGTPMLVSLSGLSCSPVSSQMPLPILIRPEDWFSCLQPSTEPILAVVSPALISHSYPPPKYFFSLSLFDVIAL